MKQSNESYLQTIKFHSIQFQHAKSAFKPNREHVHVEINSSNQQQQEVKLFTLTHIRQVSKLGIIMRRRLCL